MGAAGGDEQRVRVRAGEPSWRLHEGGRLPALDPRDHGQELARAALAQRGQLRARPPMPPRRVSAPQPGLQRVRRMRGRKRRGRMLGTRPPQKQPHRKTMKAKRILTEMSSSKCN